MGWVLRLVETGIDGSSRSVDVLEIVRPGDLADLAALGLTLADGRQLLPQVQQAVVAAQSRDHAARRPECRTCATPVPFTGQTVGGIVAPLTDRADPPGATFCPLCHEHLGGTRAPAAGRG